MIVLRTECSFIADTVIADPTLKLKLDSFYSCGHESKNLFKKNSMHYGLKVWGIFTEGLIQFSQDLLMNRTFKKQHFTL